MIGSDWILAAFLAHCADLAISAGPLWLGLFLAGLAGSASHCAFMCGPFALAQMGARLVALQPGEGEWRRLIAAALLPYHAGRLTTYMALGALLASPVAVVARISQSSWLAGGALILAGVIFLMLGISRWRSAGFRYAVPGSVFWEKRIGDWTRPLFARPWGWRGYCLGLLLGFLPCGLLYAALAAAAASADPWAAAFAMGAFAIGTWPILWAIAYWGEAAARRWQGWARRLMPAIAMLNALILFGLGLRLMIS